FVVHAARLVLPSFPTRRSSDLGREAFRAQARSHRAAGRGVRPKSGSSNVAESPCPWEKNKKRPGKCRGVRPAGGERKSPPGASRSEEHTLNSSHVKISYAVFCL